MFGMSVVEMVTLGVSSFLKSDEESSIKIALYATDYYQWDGDVRDEEKVIKFAMELANGFEENNDLRLKLMGKKLH